MDIEYRKGQVSRKKSRGGERLVVEGGRREGGGGRGRKREREEEEGGGRGRRRRGRRKRGGVYSPIPLQDVLALLLYLLPLGGPNHCHS